MHDELVDKAEEFIDGELEETDRATRVANYIQKNKGKLDKAMSIKLAEDLMTVSDNKLTDVEYYYLKNPLQIFLVTFFFGWLGIDRFLMGDIGMGVFKFFTCGGFFIVNIIDLFKLPKRIKEENVAGIYVDILDK